MAIINFDASKVDPMVAFEPVPAGMYLVKISASEMKATKAGSGQYLKLTFVILEGEHKGQRLYARINLENPNPQTVQIAHSELSAVCHAVGVMRPKQSEELHGLPLCVKVVQEIRSDNGEMTNEIKGYEPKQAALSKPVTPPAPAPATPPVASGPAAPPPAAPTQGNPPWNR